MMVNCPVCGKLTAIYWPEFWVYRRRDTFYCSENCMIVDETMDLKLMNQVARDRRLRKEAKKMGNHKLTLEQKKKAVEIASQGGNPTEYLKKCGSKNPYAAWDYIQKTLAKKIKAEVMAIPQIKVQEPKPVLTEKVDKVPEPVGGGEWEKLPEESPVSAGQAMQNMKDAADNFFRQCGEMGLKMDGPEKKDEPEKDDGFTMIMIESKKTGNRYEWREEFNMFTFWSHGVEVALDLDDLKTLLAEIGDAAVKLGVNL